MVSLHLLPLPHHLQVNIDHHNSHATTDHQQEPYVRPNRVSHCARRNPGRAAVRKCVATPCIATPHLIVRSYPRTLHLNLPRWLCHALTHRPPPQSPSLALSCSRSSPTYAHSLRSPTHLVFPLDVRRTRPYPLLTPPLSLSSLSSLLCSMHNSTTPTHTHRRSSSARAVRSSTRSPSPPAAAPGTRSK